MRKRFFVYLLSCIIATIGLVGCSNSKTTNDTKNTGQTKNEKVVKEEQKEDVSDENKAEPEVLTEDLSEYSDIKWPKSSITSALPKPKSTVGKIMIDTDDTIMVSIANTSDADYDEYVEKCRDKGFNVNYGRNDTMYTASDDNNREVLVTKDDDHVMSITAAIKRADDTTSK